MACRICFMPGSLKNLISALLLGKPLCARNKAKPPSPSFSPVFPSLINRLASVRNWLAQRRWRRITQRLQEMGPGSEVDPSVTFVFPERVRIGEYVYVGPGGYLNGRGGLVIGPHTILAPEVAVMTSMHRYKGATLVPYDETELLKSVVIGRCVWIGLRAMVLPGVTIGEGSIIGAGAVVTRSCDPGSIVVGNPARIIGTRDMDAYKACVDRGDFYLRTKQERRLQKQERRQGS